MNAEQVAQIIEKRLFRNPSIAARSAIRELAGELLTRITRDADIRIAASMAVPNRPKRSVRTGIPMHIAAVDACAMAVGVDVDKSLNHQNVAQMKAIAWMMRRGIAFPFTPSLPEIAAAMGYKSHSVVLEHIREAQEYPELITAMYDYCESFGMKMHPRPDWAKRKEVA